jgi:hypothetical protein
MHILLLAAMVDEVRPTIKALNLQELDGDGFARYWSADLQSVENGESSGETQRTVTLAVARPDPRFNVQRIGREYGVGRVV